MILFHDVYYMILTTILPLTIIFSVSLAISHPQRPGPEPPVGLDGCSPRHLRRGAGLSRLQARLCGAARAEGRKMTKDIR